MATKITEKVTINAPGEDIVFDGVDFTGNAYIFIEAANSVSLKNCRIYNMADTGKSVQFFNSVNAPKCKIIIERCFFGDNKMEIGKLYNLINLDAVVMDGTSFSHNYFTDKCCTHNEISLYNADEGATINICNNVFEETDGGIRLGMCGSPACTFNVNDNVGLAGVKDYPEYNGILLVQPCGKKTDSFENCTINMNMNVYPENQIIYGYSGANDTMLDETNSPKVFINGKQTQIRILHS